MRGEGIWPKSNVDCLIQKGSFILKGSFHIAGVDWKAYPSLAKWVQKIWARPAVKKGLAVPSPSKFYEMLDDVEAYNTVLKEAADILSKAEEADAEAAAK